MPFVPIFDPTKRVSKASFWFIFHEQKLLIKNRDSDYSVPEFGDLKELGLVPLRQQYLGTLDGRPCYAAEFPGSRKVPDPFIFIGLREIFNQFEEDTVLVAGLANQLVQWNLNHLFCGRCGNPTSDKEDERAKICHRCGSIYYPRLSPAIIVAVVKGSLILLAHSKRFPAKFYSTLAGFVEPGETLEECVRREVREEVGISLKNIKYFGSQPWPFPDSLMIGFTAEYGGGEISIDNSEIADAGWFSPENLPAIPPKISIARKLIDWYIEEWHKLQKPDGKL